MITLLLTTWGKHTTRPCFFTREYGEARWHIADHEAHRTFCSSHAGDANGATELPADQVCATCVREARRVPYAVRIGAAA